MTKFVAEMARIDKKQLASGYESLSPVERIIYCVDTLNYALLSGGWEQYFDDEAGNVAADAIAALHTIGATETATLLASASCRFPGGAPAADRGFRLDQLRAMKADGFTYLDFSEEDGKLMELLEAFWKGQSA